jgi:hypothetical protein
MKEQEATDKPEKNPGSQKNSIEAHQVSKTNSDNVRTDITFILGIATAAMLFIGLLITLGAYVLSLGHKAAAEVIAVICLALVVVGVSLLALYWLAPWFKTTRVAKFFSDPRFIFNRPLQLVYIGANLIAGTYVFSNSIAAFPEEPLRALGAIVLTLWILTATPAMVVGVFLLELSYRASELHDGTMSIIDRLLPIIAHMADEITELKSKLPPK